MNIYLIVLLVYGAALICLGLFLARTVRDARAFFVANRRLGPGLLFSTVLAANIGAGSTVGAAGLGYSVGLSGWWWVGSAGLGSLLLALVVGPRMRRMAARFDLLTLGDFLEHRYGPEVRALVAVLLWLGTLTILAGQLIAFSWILQVVTGTTKFIGCLIGGSVVIAYFAAGGLKAAAWVNLLQLSVKGAGFLLALPFALAAVGGWEGLTARLAGHGSAYLRLTGSGWSDVLPYVILLAPSFVVSPGLLQKIYGARDDRAVRLGTGANAVALLGFSFFPVLLGMIAAALYPSLPHSELALPTVITGVLPTWLGALLLAAVFSAEVSSADAILFMLSTSLTRDLYQRFLKPDISDRRLLNAGRLLAFFSGLAGIAASVFLESVISALSIFYGLISVALFVPVLAGLLRSRPGARTCAAIIVISVGSAGLFHAATSEGWGPLSPTFFGILVSFALFGLAARRRDVAIPSPARPPFPESE
ncbi:MAG: sodium:solute symporter family protein [Acidobacteriota bacterium]